MTADVTFADALHTLQSGRSIHFDALKQLPVTWYDVVKMAGNRAQRALLGRTRPRLVGVHAATGQLLVVKLDSLHYGSLKWTRKVQDVQQLFQLRRRMGDNTYTQLTMEFFPQGGGEKFADIFLFQGGAAQRFVAQVGSFRVSKQLHHHTAGHSTTLAGTHAGTPPRCDSAPELADTPAAHSNPLYTPESSKQMVDYDGMDYKQRFQAKLAARRAAAAAGVSPQLPAHTGVPPSSSLMDDEHLLTAPEPTAPAAPSLQLVDELAFLFSADSAAPASASSPFSTSRSPAPPPPEMRVSTNPFASAHPPPPAATWTSAMDDPFNGRGLAPSGVTYSFNP